MEQVSKLTLKIKEIAADGKIKANVRYVGVDYKYKLRGKINGNKIKFHYVGWTKAYDLKGAIEGDLMKLRSYNDRPGICEGGYHLKFKLKKQ